MKRIVKYARNILIALDQLLNTLAGGDADETISSVIGKMKRSNDGEVPRRHPIYKLTDWFLEKIDPGHSEDHIEEDEGKDSLRGFK